jgi:hypothetical protein
MNHELTSMNLEDIALAIQKTIETAMYHSGDGIPPPFRVSDDLCKMVLPDGSLGTIYVVLSVNPSDGFEAFEDLSKE